MKVLLALDLVALAVTSYFLFSGRAANEKTPVAIADDKKGKRKLAKA